MSVGISIPEIRPCPFCGNKMARAIESCGCFFVGCREYSECGATGPQVRKDLFLKEYNDDKEVAAVAAKIEAIVKWNNCPRATTDERTCEWCHNSFPENEMIETEFGYLCGDCFRERMDAEDRENNG